MQWTDISALKLPDGSSPPLLSTVIASVASPSITLYVELKSQKGAAQLAETLTRNPHLLRGMHFIFISFSLQSLNILRQQFQAATPLRLLWLVDNPRVPYPPEALDDGELTFDIGACTFGQFLDAHGLRQLFLDVAPDGLGIQFVTCWADTPLRGY
jgi:glycerophosphoryl diester phosphodiesterase